MNEGPLAPDILFHLGPIPIARQVVTTWGVGLLLLLLGVLAFGRAGERHPRLRAAVELLVEFERAQLRAVLQEDADRYLPFLGSLFLFLLCSNLLGIVPGLAPPTAHPETPAALALLVFLLVHVEGLRARGVLGHLGEYLRPSILLLPIHIVSELSRTFALAVRLFGNIASHELVIGVLLSIAGLLVPVPFLLLSILIGLVQAYIFTVLATVFLAAAIGRGGEEGAREEGS